VQSLARDASGEGTSIHWSRLLEFLALPFVLGLRPLLGLERAIIAVGAMAGPVSLGCLAAALCWAARPFVAWLPALIFVSAATVMAPVLKNYGAPGVFGHHLAIAVCLALACGCAARACRDAENGLAAAAGAGLWCGLGTWFSSTAARRDCVGCCGPEPPSSPSSPLPGSPIARMAGCCRSRSTACRCPLSCCSPSCSSPWPFCSG
jgi:hypothetical protein